MNVLSILERQTLPFHFSVERNGTEENGKNAFTLAPRTIAEWLERFSLCSVNAVLVSNAWIEHKRVQYWWWLLRQWCRDVASGADRHHEIAGSWSSSLVAVLFREAFSHPYFSFFHLLVNGFSVIIIIIIIIIHFFIQVFSECTEAVATSLIPLVTNFPEICAFIIGFSFTIWTKWGPCWLINRWCASWRHFNSSPPTDTAHQLK